MRIVLIVFSLSNYKINIKSVSRKDAKGAKEGRKSGLKSKAIRDTGNAIFHQIDIKIGQKSQLEF
jgi:hypothetical protein